MGKSKNSFGATCANRRKAGRHLISGAAVFAGFRLRYGPNAVTSATKRRTVEEQDAGRYRQASETGSR